MNINLPDKVITNEQYDRWIKNIKKSKTGRSWCYLKEHNNIRRQVKLIDDKLCYGGVNKGEWGFLLTEEQQEEQELLKLLDINDE